GNMAFHTRQSFLDRAHCGVFQPARHAVVVGASRPSKGFGKVPKDTKDERKDGHRSKADGMGDKQVVREAAAAANSLRGRHRPISPEEAARGKLDYVQVADWGDGDRSKLGDLKLVRHVQQYAGSGAAATTSSSSSTSSASSGISHDNGNSGTSGEPGTTQEQQQQQQPVDEAPFHVQLAQQLQMAEARGALTVAGPPPPPLPEWSWREGRYLQYLADWREVHAALEAALSDATADLPPLPRHQQPQQPSTSPSAPSSTPSPSTPSSMPATAAPPAAASPPTPTSPRQCARLALLPLCPGVLGLERSTALGRDVAALAGRGAAGGAAAGSATAGVATAAAAAASTAWREPEGGGERGGGGEGEGQQQQQQQGWESAGAAAAKEPYAAGVAGWAVSCTAAAGPMARSYGQVLRRLGRVAAGGETEQERQAAALRLLSHTAVVHMVGQAAGVRLGATAAEKLGLLQRGAAATYHEYPPGVTDPRVTLYRALDAAGCHVADPAGRQVVFDEVPGAMRKVGLLMSALAHRD
ncbi:hypothetical protein Agub_g7110, partial [Astrephomene gubernaculifera]